jgi:hypothetical protein
MSQVEILKGKFAICNRWEGQELPKSSTTTITQATIHAHPHRVPRCSSALHRPATPTNGLSTGLPLWVGQMRGGASRWRRYHVPTAHGKMGTAFPETGLSLLRCCVLPSAARTVPYVRAAEAVTNWNWPGVTLTGLHTPMCDGFLLREAC